MMFASKMPSLRIDQSELKCKSGCDFYGNPQWQGYCSKCHMEQMERQKRAAKISSTATLPKPEQKRSDRVLKLTSHSSFSKFEEKRLRQSEPKAKANLLKFSSVFKKSNTAEEHDHLDRRQQEFKVPSQVYDGMRREFRAKFTLSQGVEKDCRAFVHSLIVDVMRHCNTLSVDELSGRVQKQYQRFMKHMETSPVFAQVDADMRERLMDYVEKHAMSYLHDLPSVVFSPSGTDDERLDRLMSERIQQLSWIGEKHLECNLDRDSANCRQLLYKAISELLGMDSGRWPQSKLFRARRAARHVLALCTGHASADDLLPNLIFTVLKANPPRLISNINFVTRFCNAQRLMTGEAGYYFTNLCCAVSFIENITAESLNMDKKEFDGYMTMPASIGGSAWAAALSLCAELREADEQKNIAEKLIQEANRVTQRAGELAENAQVFEREISRKVDSVLSKTPLEIKPRRELPRFGKFKDIKTASLIDINVAPKYVQSEHSTDSSDTTDGTEYVIADDEPEPPQQPEATLVPVSVSVDEVNERNEAKASVQYADSSLQYADSPSKSPQHFDNSWNTKHTNSMELLTPSPLGFTPFDSRSIDELMTPDDFGDQLPPGLSNVNYDIDLSDFSGDNSLAEDPPKPEPKDPFSPDGIKKDPFQVLMPQRDPFSTILDTFDQFSLLDSKMNESSVPFELVPRSDPYLNNFSVNTQKTSDVPVPKDPFSPIDLRPVDQMPSTSAVSDPFAQVIQGHSKDPFSSESCKNTSILDDSSPTVACLLPSPLQPQSSKQT